MQARRDYRFNGIDGASPMDIPLFKIVEKGEGMRIEVHMKANMQRLHEFLLSLSSKLVHVQKLYITNDGDNLHIYIIMSGEKLHEVEESIKHFIDKTRIPGMDVAIRNGEELICISDGFPVMVDGYRVIVVLKELFEELSDHFVKYLGSGGAALLWHLGKKWGEIIAVKLGSRISGPSTTLKRLTSIMEILRATGWGIFTLDAMDPIQCRGSISVRDSCELKSPLGCHFIRGVLAGILSEVFGVNISVKEVVHNDTGRCTFVFYCNNL